MYFDIKCNFFIIIFFIMLQIQFKTIESLHLKGKFKANEFFKFLTRFGFQSTDTHNEELTQGYIYGEVRLSSSSPSLSSMTTTTTKSNNYKDISNSRGLLTLIILEKNEFLELYKKRHIKPRDYACSIMFDKLSKGAYDSTCNKNATFDLYRKVPCQYDSNSKMDVCVNQYKQNDYLIKGSQFTFKISDSNEAKFLYLSIVACERDNLTCSWYGSIDESEFNSKNDINYEIDYSIYLTNGNPNLQSFNRFEHHFTYELHDIFEIYLITLVIYLLILPFVIYRVCKYYHHLYLILLVYISIEVATRFMFLIHNLVYSFNGVGIQLFDYIGWLLEIFSSCVLILILLLIAKGYTILTKHIKLKKKFFFYWLILSIFLITSHIIALLTFNIIFNTNYYETYAGYVELCIRIIFMIWFLKELKRTFTHINAINANANATVNINCNNNLNSINTDNLGNRNNNNNNTNRNENNNKYFNDNESDQHHHFSNHEQNGYVYNSNDTDKLIESDLNSDKTKKLSNNEDDDDNEYIISIKSSLLNSNRMNLFYLHFGACSLVWFIYLPILVFISVLVSDLFRYRLMLSMFLSKNNFFCFALLCLTCQSNLNFIYFYLRYTLFCQYYIAYHTYIFNVVV